MLKHKKEKELRVKMVLIFQYNIFSIQVIQL